jgi:HlyD family secretion protein
MTHRAIVSFAALSLLLAGCVQKPGAVKPTADAPGVALKSVKPERKTVQRIIDQPAHIDAFEETPLVARIAGYVQKMHVDIGDRVKGPRYDESGKQIESGQLLAELWVPEMDEELRQKQATVAQYEAMVEQAHASVDAATAHIATAKAAVKEAEAGRLRAQASFERWESQYRTMENLVLKKVIDEQSREEVRNQYKAADAGRAEVEAKVQSMQAMAKESEAQRDRAIADLTAAKARVKVARADADRVAALVGFSKIRAPFDGVVVRRNINTGTFVQPDAAKNFPSLFVVARRDIVRVFAEIPETDAGYVRDEAPAEVRIQALGNRSFPAKVTRTSWSLDSRSRTLRTELDLSNTADELRPGMYAYIRITSVLKDRWVVPAGAVLADGEQFIGYRLVDGKAVRTPLRVGLKDGQVVELLEKQERPANPLQPAGWQAITGDEVFLQGNLSMLKDGQEVPVLP